MTNHQPDGEVYFENKVINVKTDMFNTFYLTLRIKFFAQRTMLKKTKKQTLNTSKIIQETIALKMYRCVLAYTRNLFL